jgi:hypothetical protein
MEATQDHPDDSFKIDGKEVFQVLSKPFMFLALTFTFPGSWSRGLLK